MANTTFSIMLKKYQRAERLGCAPNLDTEVALPASMGTPRGRRTTYRTAFTEYCSDETMRSVEGHKSEKALQTYEQRKTLAQNILHSQV